MFRWTRLLILLALALPLAAPAFGERIEKGNLVLEGIPEIPEELVSRYRQYENTRSAFMVDWHPSGKGILISTRFGETNQLHWVREPGGARHQLTFYDEPVSGATAVPSKDRQQVVFGKDVGGSEFFQLFLFDLENGTHHMLTDGKSRNGGASISHSGDRMAFYTTKRNSRDWDIHLLEFGKDGATKPLLEKGGYWVVGSWSPDDEHLILASLVSANETRPYLLEVATGELRSLQESEEPAAYGAVAWAADGKGIYYSSDHGSEFMQLRYLDLKTYEHEVLTADIPWNVGQIAASDDGKWLAFSYNENGMERFVLWDAKTRKEVNIPNLPVGGQIFGLQFSPESDRMGFTMSTPQTPGDVYVLDLESRAVERWTHSEVGGLDTSKFEVPELVYYPTFDEVDGKPRMIPAFYYKPVGAKGPVPVLVEIHGGPEAQFRPFFDSQTQFLVNELGIAVIAPNVRGSSGYGKSYLKLDNGYQREDSVKDIGHLLDWIAENPELDAERVAVMGGSYGGYMVLAAMTHYNDRLRGGIDVVGISNFVTFLENTEEYRRDLRRVEYGDERDPEMRAFLEKISPTTNAHKITKPLFIAQGLNDPRVPASEAEQILDAVKENGGKPWYFLANDEGHGFRKKSNRDQFNYATILFLEKILLDKTPAVRMDSASQGR